MKRILEYKNKFIWALVLIVIVSALGIYGNRIFMDDIKGKSSIRVSFNFEGVDQGLNPQGGVFDAQVIKSEDVLQSALDELGWSEDKIDIKTLASHMIVRGIVPSDVMGRILPNISTDKNMQMEKVGGLTYHPTQYEVALSISKDMKLNKNEANQLVNAVVDSYTKFFITRYKDTQAIETAITKIDPERYDYSEYLDLVTGQLQVIKSYLSAKEQSSKDFKSKATSLSFGDLIAQVELIEDVEVGNVQALLDSFVITKDSKESAVVYANMIHRMKRDNEKYMQQAQILKNVANSYQKDKQVILGSGTQVVKLEEEDDEEDKDKEPLYDTLVKDANLAESRANRLGRQVKYYEGLLDNLNAQNQSGTNANIELYIQEVEQSIVYISNQMAKTMESIIDTVDDYYTEEVFEGSITPIREAKYRSSFRIYLIKDTALIAGITFMMLLLGLIYSLGKKNTDIKQ